jgi:two-component system heavy metal sensor histidine kinase CusS
MSLRARIATACSVVALVTTSSAFAAVWLAFSASQVRELDSELLREAAARARDVSYAPGSGEGRGRLEPSRDDGLFPQYAVVYGPDGRVIDSTLNLAPARPRFDIVRHAPNQPFDLWWNNERLRAVFTDVRGRDGDSLLLATPRTDLDADDRDLARRMMVAVVVAVAGSAGAAWWFSRVLTRDHDRIATVARAVAGGDLSARIGEVADDPEMRRLAGDLDDMIGRLAVLLETQQHFIANASHELRSPVTTMLGELSFALHRDRDASSYRQSIEEALDAARRLRLLTDDLLALARIGATELQREPVRLSEVAEAAMAPTRAAADAKGVVMEADCEGAVVEGHLRDLERLVRNLLENAVRLSPPGGRVRVQARGGAREVRLVVSDEGPGVAPDLRERIFEPFFRSAADRAERTGTGLGLAIGRSIARAHGGDLWLDDGEPRGGGARFVVRLPAPELPSPVG